MKRFLGLLLLATGAAAIAMATLPPRSRPVEVPSTLPAGVRGAIHVHTRRSDGSGTAGEVAAAAARAGLQFIILTDHDTAASEPTKPYYHHGVLLIEGVEISTDDGHVVALDLPQAPYPLGGEARDVVEDIERLGGFSIAAHPGSEKPELQWRAWDEPFDGLEWLNGDSEWRDEPMTALAAVPFAYPFRAAETIARMLDRPEPILQRWDDVTTRRRVVAVAAADAHARIGLRSGEPDDPWLGLHLPSYEAIFEAFSITVTPASFGGDPAADARLVIEAIRAGRVYSSIDAIASPAVVSFSATSGGHRFTSGDVVRGAGREIELHVDSNAPDGARIVLLRNGSEEASVVGPRLSHAVGAERGTYRAEVHLPAAPGQPPVPWVVSNPIYVGLVEEPRPPPRRLSAVSAQYENGPGVGWTAASSVRSQAVLDVTPGPGGTQLSMRFGLGGTMAESPYAALVMPAGPLRGYDRLMFTVRAAQPMRLSVQLRVPTAGDGERWHRSVYLDQQAREITVFFDDMRPRGVTRQPHPDLAMVHAVMFVVDTVNTKPGSSGQLWIDDVRYGR